VRACRRGDPAAWETLVRRYRRLIYSIPVGYRLSREDADEIFQQVALKLFEHLDRLRNDSSLVAWLSVTTRRACQALLRGGKAEVELDADGAGADEGESTDPADRLHRIACEHTLSLALERMDASCRELLRMLYYEAPPPAYEEIARRLRRPVGSLGPTRSRCLKKLRKLYRELGGEEP